MTRRKPAKLMPKRRPTVAEHDELAIAHDDLRWDLLVDRKKRRELEGRLARVEELILAPSTAGDVPTDSAELTISPDGASVNWRGKSYSFTRTQAACVNLLCDRLRKGIPDVPQAYILETVESTARNLPAVFRSRHSPTKYHPAWKDLIVPGQRKGTFRLAAAAHELAKS